MIYGLLVPFFYRLLIAVNHDPWLDKWLPLIREKSAGGFLLELGWDTAHLPSTDCKVIAADLSMGDLEDDVIHLYEKPKSVWEMVSVAR